jgi:polysaccharide pyruvyl transferase WcaK-like protein
VCLDPEGLLGAKKVAIINTTNMANQGSAGRLSGLLNCLEETIPGVEMTVWHRYYRQDQNTFSAQYIRDYPGLKIRRHPWFNEYGSNSLTAIAALFSFGIFAAKCGLSKLIRQPKVKFARDLDDYQAVLDLNLIEPDKLTDRYDLVSSVGVFFALLNTLSAAMTGVPVLICSATIGPYNSRLLRWFARFCLNRVEVITLREKYSQDYLPTLGVTKPQIYLSADLAFLLNPWRS